MISAAAPATAELPRDRGGIPGVQRRRRADRRGARSCGAWPTSCMDLAHAPLDELADRLRDRLLAEAAQEPGDGTLHGRIAALVDREAGLLDAATRADLAARIARRSFGLGPLEPLLADPAVDEVMVNGTAPVWVERAGRLEVTGVAFADEAALRHAIERVLAPLGRRVDEAEPLCDARLPDRTRRVRRLSAHERRLGRASCSAGR